VGTPGEKCGSVVGGSVAFPAIDMTSGSASAKEHPTAIATSSTAKTTASSLGIDLIITFITVPSFSYCTPMLSANKH
jgi:hypothetical protein